MKYFKKIKGERVYLSPINLDDYELFTKWLNDDDNVSRFITTSTKVIGLEKEKESLKNLILKGDYIFSIVLEDTDEVIGNISLGKLDFINKTASLGITIGEKDKQSKGYGTEAVKILINYGFKTLNLYNINLSVYEYNERAIKSYKKVGFKEYGRRTKAKYDNGEYYDVIYMEILNEK